MLRLLAMVLAALLSSGCVQRPHAAFKSTDITGSTIGGVVQLSDHHGKMRRLEDFQGKAVVMFFGFTHCPDVCPTTLLELKRAMQQLGVASKDVQVLFVTVDPERDTPEVLAKYVTAFDPRFIGLTGSTQQIKAVADAFKVYYAKSKVSETGNYSVDHFAGSYIFDKQGRLRLFVNYGAGGGVFAHDLKLLLAE